MTMTIHNTIANVEHVDTTVDTTTLETVGDAVGNDILVDIARGEKVGRVSSGRAMRGEVRGWTMGGRVD